MPYRQTAIRIHEIVRSVKALGSGESVIGEKKGPHGLHFSVAVDRINGPFLEFLSHS